MRAQAQVLPAEGDDARVRGAPGRDRQAVGLPAGAEDRVARRSTSAPSQARPRRCSRATPVTARPSDQLAARAAQVVGQRPRHGAEVDDPGVGRVQGGDARAWGSSSAISSAPQAAQARHAVGAAAALELVEARQLAARAARR